MRAQPGEVPASDEGWAFEVLWTGRRTIGFQRPGELVLRDAKGADLNGLPEVRRAARSLGHTEAVLDGVLTVLGEGGEPDPERLEWRLEASSDATARRRSKQAPASLVLFDVLHHDGESLVDRGYEERRERLFALELDGETVRAPAHHVGDGAALLEASGRRALAGIIAKELRSRYLPGQRSSDWLEIRSS